MTEQPFMPRPSKRQPPTCMRLRRRRRIPFAGIPAVLAVLGLVLAVNAALPAAAPNSDASPGAQVVVVYNTRVPESRQVADYYAQRRQVPTNQLFGFDLPTGESMSRTEFVEKLQQPLIQRLIETGLIAYDADTKVARRVTWARIRYAVLCYGVPTKIEPDPKLNEPGFDKVRPEMRRNEASVDSQLACLPSDPTEVRWAGFWPNRQFGATNAAALHPTNGILLVGRLDGPSSALARGLVDKALEAETNGLWGRAVFDIGYGLSNTNYQQGDLWIKSAAELCRRLGFETALDAQPATIPPGHVLPQLAFYGGWYADHVNGPFTWGGAEFMPGAFAYHLHSFSAATIRTTNSHWVGPLIAQGATCTMGSVFEPYLAGTPDLAIFFMRFLAGGFTFGEAAWASQQVLSWQNIAVGDPLYRPFGLRPDQRIEDLERRQSPLVEWYFLMLVDMNLAASGDAARAIINLETLGLTPQSAILQEKLADLLWTNKRLSDSLAAYEKALKLKTSPLHKLRTLLRYANRCTQYGRTREAFDTYHWILNEFPRYPDQLTIYQSILPLAQKLDLKDEVASCEQHIKRLQPPPPAGTPAPANKP